MGVACSGCLGRGYTGDGKPCSTCKTKVKDAKRAYDVQQALRRPGKSNTVEVVDGEYRPGMEDEPFSDARGAGFSEAEIAAQNAKDLAAMQREGMTRR